MHCGVCSWLYPWNPHNQCIFTEKETESLREKVIHPKSCVPAIAQSCPILCKPVDCSPQAPLSMRFSRQEYCSGLLFSSPGDLPNPGAEPVSPASPALAGGFFTTSPPSKGQTVYPSLHCLSVWSGPKNDIYLMSLQFACFFLATLCSMGDLSSLTRDQNTFSLQSLPLDHQGKPS